jgi:hypothetical protein
MTTSHRFRAEVVVHLNVCVDADSHVDAEDLARRMAARQRIRPSDVVRVSAVRLDVGQCLTHDNICVWQENEVLARGTSNQRQRWDSGCLPDNELRLLARTELFRPFSLCPRRVRKGPSAIPHPKDDLGAWLCAATAINGTIAVAWKTRPDPELTETQWQSLQRLLAASDEVRRHPWMRMSQPTSVRLAIREHSGECAACRQRTAENAALVEIDWAGRTLSREYML